MKVITAVMGLLISWATPAASRPTLAWRSEAMRRCSLSSRWRTSRSRRASSISWNFCCSTPMSLASTGPMEGAKSPRETAVLAAMRRLTGCTMRLAKKAPVTPARSMPARVMALNTATARRRMSVYLASSTPT